MNTSKSSRKRWLAGASALLLGLFLPQPPTAAAELVAQPKVVPTLIITADAASHGEPDGPMSFTLHASPGPAADLEVKLDSRLTGVIFTDAVERSFTETIPADKTSHTFEFPIVNDFTVEPDGAATVTIADSETDYDVGVPSQAVTALVDDDVIITVTWDPSTVHVDENAGSVRVPFTMRTADGQQPGTFTTVDGTHEGATFLLETSVVTATPKEDFVDQSLFPFYDVGSFTVDDSGNYTLSGEIEIEILDDTEDEPGETFALAFTSALPEALRAGDAVLPTEFKTIVIADDDGVNNAPQFVTTPEDLSVGEGIEVGTLIGVPFEATDYDGHAVTFAVAGTDVPFAIDAETNTLEVTETLDFETQDEYAITVVAADSAGGSTETSVTIRIDNVNEPGVVEPRPEITISTSVDTVSESDRRLTVEVHADRAPSEDIEVMIDVNHPGQQLLWNPDDLLTISIRAGSMSRSRDVVINNDAAVETEGLITFTIVESDDEHGDAIYTIGNPSSATVTVHDDDSAVTVLYTANPFTVSESAGTVALPITARVDGGSPPGSHEIGGVHYDGPPFDVTTTAGTATPGTDFEEPDYFVQVDLGSYVEQESGNFEASGFLTVTILDDDVIEENESFTVQLRAGTNDVNALTLPPQALTVIIEDDDRQTDPLQQPWPPPDFCPTHPDTVTDTSTPLSVEVGGSVEADFCSRDDADWVQVNLVSGQAYRIEGTYVRSDGERRIFIGGMRQSDGSRITGSHSFDGNPEGTSNTSGYINFRPTDTGSYYIVAGDMDWWDFTDATAPLPWRIEVHEIDLPPDDVPDVTHLTQEFNNYGQLKAEFDGTINTHGDRDTFAIDVVAGHQYFVEMRSRTGSRIFNCIHDVTPEGTVRASTGRGTFDCPNRPGWKAFLWFTARTEGRYLITVGSENGTGDYELWIRDTNAVPPGVWDTPLPEDDIAHDTSSIGRIYINDSWINGTGVTGEIDLAGDKDWFRVELEGGQRYQIDVRGEGSGVGTLRNSFVWIHDAEGQRLAYASGGGDFYFDTRLIWTPPASGTYFIQVAGSQYEIGTYDLSVLDFSDTTTIHRPSGVSRFC